VSVGGFHGTLGIFCITLFSTTGGFPTKHGYLHRIRIVSGGQDN
jgi:hypothetical protein